MDPQGNLTMSQGVDPDKVEKSMFDVLVHRIPISEIIVEREIDVAVASIDLAGAEIAMSTQIGRERALQKGLDEVRNDYDFVCIDTPPSLGLLTVNALTAADKVIVPVQCEYLSMRGLVQLQNTLTMIRENLNPGVEIEGILPTMLDSRTVHAKEAVEILEENFGELVFKSRIRKAIKFAEAPVRGTSVLKYDPKLEGRGRLPRPREGGPHPWLVGSAPACARAPSPICSARPTSRSAPDEVKVTANGAGTAPVEVAVEEPVQETPGPRARPGADARAGPRADAGPRSRATPRARARPRADAARARRRDQGRGAAGRGRRSSAPRSTTRAWSASWAVPAPTIRPAFGREEPDTSSPTRQPVVPRTHQAVLRVVGVGGAGVNAVNRMVEAELPGVEFLAINTDLQSLQNSNADVTLHIGAELTRGLGSGSDPRVGYRAAFEEQDKIKELLKGSDMVFLASGSGGGTGTGAAPVVAKLARDIGALTVAAVTKPFSFEGARRAAQAEEGIAALGKEVDTMIVVPNERLLTILERRTSIVDAFKVADDVLRQAVQGISDLVMLPGLINLDFADVRTTMIEAGDAILGIGMGYGEHRATHRRREGRLLAAARDLGRGRALDAPLDHRRPRPLPDRGERGRRGRQGRRPPGGGDHLRRQRRRGHERGGLDHRDRHSLRLRLLPPSSTRPAHRVARAAHPGPGRGAAAGALRRPRRRLARARARPEADGQRR